MHSLRIGIACAAVAAGASLLADTVPVRHVEGVVRGFLVLRTLEGATLADGDLTQFARGDRVTTRLTFRFKDGSLHEETAFFSQSGRFHLLRDHLVQRGPSFPHPVDAAVDLASGRVTVRSRDSKGEEKVDDERLPLPDDAANGLLLTLIKNVDPRAAATTVSLVATTPKPRIVKVVISPEGEDPFSIGSTSHKAIRYRARIEIGGITGLLAKLVGKQPPDTHVWVLPGQAPAFVRSEGPLYFGGPIWRIELTTPVWPRSTAENAR